MKLELRHIAKTFRDRSGITPAVADVSFTVESGAFVSLIGVSGGGKSTIFNLITGLIRPDAGDILLGDQVITGTTGQVGYMPQRDLLLPWRTVLQNAVLGAEIDHKPHRDALARAKSMLPLFGLEGFGDAYPAALSGGMRGRAALLRTFLMDRPILLLDEPFGALDALTRREMQDWLLTVWARLRPTILLITHDVREAAMLSDRVIVLTARPAQVRLEVPIDLPRPRRDDDPAFLAIQHRILDALETEPASR